MTLKSTCTDEYALSVDWYSLAGGYSIRRCLGCGSIIFATQPVATVICLNCETVLVPFFESLLGEGQ